MAVIIKKAVQSIAPEDQPRAKLIEFLLEDRLDPACNIRPVMKDILLNGRKGFNNMTDEELRHLVRNRETLPGEPEIPPPEQKILPVGS